MPSEESNTPTVQLTQGYANCIPYYPTTTTPWTYSITTTPCTYCRERSAEMEAKDKRIGALEAALSMAMDQLEGVDDRLIELINATLFPADYTVCE